ncbi:hypothetical protein [Streptomyces europaeiscabiei]|uniref:hypothetical protein n=1 Tax=Streptomyces europaeiscabiei TaxID=146819 RepID=UPI002E10279A|nr:hypothetical protein OHB30_14580 [Streptomyces europaeiscabiei]
MDALTELTVLGLVLSAVLLAMACVKADRVRAWRSSINPSAEELPDAAFTAARVILVTAAGIGIYLAIQSFGVADDASWDDSELTTAVQGAADGLDGYMYRTDQTGDSLYFDDYATLIQDRVAQNGGGDAPQSGGSAYPADAHTDFDAYFTVKGDGAGVAFCTHIERIRSKEDDYTPPGITGGPGRLTYRAYRLAVEVKDGEC